MIARWRWEGDSWAEGEKGSLIGAGAGLGLGPDKRTGTFGSHVIDGVEDLQEPGTERRFLCKEIFKLIHGLGRDLCVGAAS